MDGYFRKYALLACLFLLSLVPTSANAEKRIALLIGNSAYQHTAPLPNPANDVRLLAGVFRALDYEVLEYRDVGYIGLKKAIRKFTTKLGEYGPEAVGFVYYAGHGLQVGGINYLVPVDAEIEKEADISLYSIKTGTLMQGLTSVGNRLNVIVLDSCRNNPFKHASRGLSVESSGGLARMDAPSGSLIAYSTSPGHVAEDGDGDNSPFSKALAQEISRPGIGIEIVLKRVRQHVFGQSSGRQLPWSSSSIIGEFCPAGCAAGPARISPLPGAAKTTDPAHQAWLTIKNSKNRRILRSFSKRYPKSLYAEFARIKMDELKPGKSRTHTAPVALKKQELRTLGQTENEEYGRFFVIMGSFPKAALPRANKRLAQLHDKNINSHIIDTNNYPNLTNGLYAVVMGPYNRDYAIFKNIKARQLVPDAYVKSGR